MTTTPTPTDPQLERIADTMALEDYLQEAAVFVNAYSKKTAHSDSYGTVVDFEALDRAIDAATIDAATIDPAVLKESLDYWQRNPNVGPTLRLVAIWWMLKLKEQAG